MADPATRPEQRDRRAELVAAAAEIINERGVEATRLSDVAERAAVSVSLLQYYFETREVLIREAFEVAVVEGFESMLDTQREIDDPWQRIDAIITELVAPAEPVQEARNWLDLCAAAAREPELQPTVQDVQARWVQLLETAVEDGIRQGAFEPELPADQVASALNALCDGMVLQLASGPPGSSRPDPAELHGLVERVAKALLRSS